MSVTEFQTNEIVSMSGVNSRIQEINNMFPVSVNNGGTGQTSFMAGQVLLGNGNNALTSVATLPVTSGGTGQTSLEGIRSSLNLKKFTILYNNPDGTSGTIQLYDSITNYDYIDIYYSGYDTSHRNFSGFWRNANVNSYGVVLNATYPQGDLKGFISREALVNVTGDSITFNRNATIMFNGSNGGNIWTFNNEKILILKVVGYSD